jgi:hypothetical protein
LRRIYSIIKGVSDSLLMLDKGLSRSYVKSVSVRTWTERDAVHDSSIQNLLRV